MGNISRVWRQVAFHSLLTLAPVCSSLNVTPSCGDMSVRVRQQVPVCTCKPGCPTRFDVTQSFACRQVTAVRELVIVIVTMRYPLFWLRPSRSSKRHDNYLLHRGHDIYVFLHTDGCCVHRAVKSDHGYCHCTRSEVDFAGSEGTRGNDHNKPLRLFVFPVVHYVIIASVVSRSTVCLRFDRAVIVPASFMLCVRQPGVLSLWNETTA